MTATIALATCVAMLTPGQAGPSPNTAAGAAQTGGQPAEMTAERASEQIRVVSLYLGRSQLVRTPWPVKRVSVTEPKIADVQILTPSQVLLLGKAIGSTDVILWSEREEVWQARIDVDIDRTRIRADLLRLFPRSTLDVGQSGEVLVVTGALSRVEQADQLHRYLEAQMEAQGTGESKFKYVDMTSVAGIQQVQLQVRFAEVSRTAIRALGINALYTGSEDFFGAVTVGSSSGGALNPINIGPAQGAFAGRNLPFTFNGDVNVSPLVTLVAGFPSTNLQFFLQALAENQYLRILAEPNLVALSGEEASFLAGGEFPIPVAQSTSGMAAAITISYRKFGVQLKFRPTVLGDGTIRLQVAPEVSELSSVGSVTIQGFNIPAISTRTANTTLELKSGQTFAMAGLLSHRNDGVTSRVPGLGDLPVIGALFRSTRYTSAETELMVLVTASLVEPLSLDKTPPLPGLTHAPPNEWELYAMGALEGKAKLSATDSAWLREMGFDRLNGPGAWATYDEAEGSRARAQDPARE